MMRTLFTLVITFTIGSLFAQGPCPPGGRYRDALFPVQKTKNIVYGQSRVYGTFWNSNLYLDLYQPDPAVDTLEQRPLIVLVHGGAFLTGFKELTTITALSDSFAAKGYVVAAIGYRLGFNILSEKSGIRAAYRSIQDARAAIRFLMHHHQAYGIDADQIYIGGTSAGAIAALNVAYLSDAERPAATFGFWGEPSDLGCLDCSGNNLPGLVSVDGIINMWGAVLDTLHIEASENTPIISFHGSDDAIVMCGQGAPFGIDALFPDMYGSCAIEPRTANEGIYNEFHLFQGQGHEPQTNTQFFDFTPYYDTIYTQATDFLFQLTRPQTPVIVGSSQLCPDGLQQTYTVPNLPGYTYCWNVSGGLIFGGLGTHQLTVDWSGSGGTVSLVVFNRNLAVGDTQIMQVSVTGAFYDISKINQVLVSDPAFTYQWFHNGTLMPGETSQTLIPMLPGTYTCTALFADGCFATSLPYIITGCKKDSYEPNDLQTSSINLIGGLLMGTSNTRICPGGDEDWFHFTTSPAQSFVTLNLSNLPYNYELELYDAYGTMVTFSTLSGTQDEKIQLNNMTPGTYYVRVYGFANAWSPSQAYQLSISFSKPAPLGSVGTKPVIAGIPFRSAGPEPEIRLYPNPGNGTLFVDLGEIEASECTIFISDLSGKQLLMEERQFEASDNLIIFDASQIPAGTYVIRCTAANFEWIDKIILTGNK